ncbi:MAG: ZIP family metal transporter [Anaerolineae bacterium]|nr:ZIP family metal transporter [Anaerolineae bacterium]MCX8068642.1 ZIP family metal transporter [Anaerolineae bacterium]MDW7992051.1 ZIP family metal transporter [Anaerolineae bacterium]
MEHLLLRWFGGNVILMGVVATVLTGLATGLGALPVLFTRRVSERLLDALMGFAAGVMLAATAFSLIVPAIELGGVFPAVVGILIGAVFLAVLDHTLPHTHFIKGAEGPKSALRRVWLLIIAITLHNFPEGLAVGIGFGSGRLSEALALMVAIGLQNMPEGLAVALPLVRERWPSGRALLYALGSGMAEPIAGLVGVLLVTVMHALLPWGLAFAAGAMLYVVSDEIIPETHSRGYEMEGTWGVIVGFVVMMILDNAL